MKLKAQSVGRRMLKAMAGAAVPEAGARAFHAPPARRNRAQQRMARRLSK